MLDQSPGMQFADMTTYIEQPSADVVALLPESVSSDASALGYRNMCHFMSIGWFLALERYVYAMRVDDDVCIQTFETDPFEFMRSKDLVYSYGLQTEESHVETVETMKPW